LTISPVSYEIRLVYRVRMIDILLLIWNSAGKSGKLVKYLNETQIF